VSNLPKELEAIGDDARDIAGSVLDTTRTIVAAVLLAAWSGMCVLVLGLGALLGSTAMIEAGAATLGVSWLFVGARALSRRRRLVRDARWSLIARTRLARIGLGSEMQAVLQSFDVAAEQVKEMLARRELASQAGVYSADFDAVRDRLFALAAEEGQLRGTARRMRRASATPSATEALQKTALRLARVRQEGDRIAGDAHRFAERLTEVRRLTEGPPLEAPASLDDALVELDRTASALREIERETSGAAQRAAQTAKE
jgi:hypothetical protein